MEKTEMLLDTEQKPKLPPLGKVLRAPTMQKKTQLISWRQVGRYVAIWSMVFLWSRGEVLQILHPMGMGVLSVFFGSGAVFWCAWSAAALGAIGSGIWLKQAGVLLAALLLHLTLGRFVTSQEIWKKAALGAFAMALGGCFYAVGQGGLQFYFVVAGVESALVMGISLLLQKGAGVLLSYRRQTVWSREETLSVLLLLGGMLVGAAHIGIPILQNRLFPSLTALFLLAAAWREGVGGGAAAGVMLGFLLFICDAADLPLFAALSFGALLAGCLKEIGRWAAALGFWLTAILFEFYMNQQFLQPNWLIWMGMGSAVFLLLPKKVLEGAGGFWRLEQSKDRYTRMREAEEERLKGFGIAFHGLAKAFTPTEAQQKPDISCLVDQVAERVCQNCGMAHYCWQEEVYRTYSMTFSMLSYCDGKGHIRSSQLPEWFRVFCPREKEFVAALCDVYDGYRHDLIWSGRLQECRELVGQQLDAVGDILEGLTGQIDGGSIYLESAEEALALACRKGGIRVRQVQVTEEKGGRGKRATLTVKACHGQGICREKILPIVKKTLGRAMVQLDADICHVSADGCMLTFVEEPAFVLTAATAFAAGETGNLCGDASSFLESERGMALMAVSDGMGTGERAAAESKAAIELLEQFSAVGFEREMAVQLINSALLLRRTEENYATLDICSVDLYDGQAEFIKLGAVASFICRQNRVISVYTHSLPAGILRQIQVEKNDMRLKDGDMLLMMTDGVTDAFGGERKMAVWLEETFMPQMFVNPKDAADFILQQAQKICSGERDDMTVQAARFWRRVGMR